MLTHQYHRFGSMKFGIAAMLLLLGIDLQDVETSGPLLCATSYSGYALALAPVTTVTTRFRLQGVLC